MWIITRLVYIRVLIGMSHEYILRTLLILWWNICAAEYIVMVWISYIKSWDITESIHKALRPDCNISISYYLLDIFSQAVFNLIILWRVSLCPLSYYLNDSFINMLKLYNDFILHPPHIVYSLMLRSDILLSCENLR